jgi:hypothetical protein
LIPLSGRIDPEDLAVTGKSARPDIQENTYLPLLYDFEELEGELNFLNRVVALSFHPSTRSRAPITLGEVKARWSFVDVDLLRFYKLLLPLEPFVLCLFFSLLTC